MTRRSARLQSRLFSLSLRIPLGANLEPRGVGGDIYRICGRFRNEISNMCLRVQSSVCVSRFADLVDACNNSGIKLTTPGFVEVISYAKDVTDCFSQTDVASASPRRCHGSECFGRATPRLANTRDRKTDAAARHLRWH